MFFTSAVSKKFEFVGSIDSQMQAFTALRESNPEKAKLIFENGAKLVEHAKAGEFRKIRLIVDSLEEGDFLVYFVSQMMLASLLGGHLMITQFIIDQGYPISNHHIPNSLHQCLELTEDVNGAAVVEFLSAKKFDINLQQQLSWLTPLHIAVRRSLFQTVRKLIELGADVNAVAKDDVMPLNLAEKLENSTDRGHLVALLKEHGARNTWRTGNATSTFNGVPTMETKQISFSGGGSGGKMSMSGQHFAPPAASNMVSMKGGGSATPTMVSCKGGGSSASNMVSFKGGGSSASNMVSFKGGGSSAANMVSFKGGGDLEKMPVEEFQQKCTVDNNKESTDGGGEEHEEASFSYSNDGGQLFSTS